MNQYEAIQNFPSVEPHQEENSPVWESPINNDEYTLEDTLNWFHTNYKNKLDIDVVENVEGNKGVFEISNPSLCLDYNGNGLYSVVFDGSSVTCFKDGSERVVMKANPIQVIKDKDRSLIDLVFIWILLDR